MKNIIILALVCLMIIVASCDGGKEKVQEPIDQRIEATITYEGTALCLYPLKHNFYIYLVDAYENIIVEKSIYSDQATFYNDYQITFPTLKPDLYYVMGFWDWNENGRLEDFEPVIYSTPIDIDGFAPVKVTLEIEDRTGTNDDGWIEGVTSYNGDKVGFGALRVLVSDISYNKLSDVKISNGSLYLNDTNNFTSGKIEAGVVQMLIYWDVDLSGDYSNGDIRSSWESPIVISPGLPTVGFNITTSSN